MEITEVIKKKRGRKPKNNIQEQCLDNHKPEKKKRGRKKKYEIENFEKIINRNYLNNFNHNIAYSDDEYENQTLIDSKVNQQISFGNLNITISTTNDEKKVTDDYRYNITERAKNIEQQINLPINGTGIMENEYSDSDSDMDIDTFLGNTKKKVSVQKCTPIKKIKIYHTLTNVVNNEHWPEKTNLCCWWCCHPFENSPCALPVKYNEYTKKYTLTGIFCSWNCTRAYNMEKNDHRSNERNELITFLVKQLSSMKDSIFIKKAPPRQILKMFGGNMNITEFRNTFSSINSYHLNLLRYIYIYPEINEITKNK